MSPRMTNEQHKKLITDYFDAIEKAVNCARNFMDEGRASDPMAITSRDSEVINTMFEMIKYEAIAGQKLHWPDPAEMAAEAAKQNAAKKDAALQKLIKRASKPTPIRALKTNTAKAAS